MNRMGFDNLEIIDQINYVNNELLNGKSLTKICKNIGIGRTTIRDRFQRIGYVFNKKENNYIHEKDKNITKIINKIDKNIVKKKNTEDINLQQYKNNTYVIKQLQEFNTIKDDLLELLENKNDILEMIKDYKNNSKVIDIPQLDINTLPQNLQENINTRSIKIYNPIYNLFNDLCKSYGSIKKQDLISLALFEFYNKYKK